MSEEQKTEEEQEEKPVEEEKVEETSEGETSEASPIDDANQILESIKREKEEFEAIVKRNEKAVAEMKLMGRSSGGSPAPMKKEETAKEYKDKFMRGELNGKG